MGMKLFDLRQKISAALLAVLLPTVVWAFGTLETRCLFYPESSDFPHDPLAAIANHPLRNSVQDVYFETADGVRLNGWFVPPRAGKPTVVFAHGNGGNIGDRYGMIQPFMDKGYGFFVFDYRGYGKSEGNPTEQGLYHDMRAASRYLTTYRNIPASQQIAMGGSLGSAVAIEAATHIPFRAVAVFAAFTNTLAVAEHGRDTNQLGWLGYLPLGLMMHQRFDSLSRIGEIHCPLLIMHGDADAMMPLSMPKALYAKATAPSKKLLIIPGGEHNTVFSAGKHQFFPALEALLQNTAL